MNQANANASAVPVPASSTGGRRPAAAAAAAFALSLVTLMFWVELLMEGDRAGFLGALRRNLLALTIGFPAVVQVTVCVGAPFIALAFALASLRDPRSRSAGLVALAASATLVALVLLAVFHDGQ
jgi:NADH:ubiquinone oxidoreductase subunit 6 (subunit J)